MTAPTVHPTAELAGDVVVGSGTAIWHLVQVREGASIGADCVIGRGVYVGPGVSIGDRVKVQNQALIYEPCTVGDGAFIGPAAVLTNDVHPRAVDPQGRLKRTDDWSPGGTAIGVGASIGAAAVVLSGVTVGAWALVAAGAVVIRDVPDHALVAGNPARHKGWVGRAGIQLVEDSTDRWQCPETGEVFVPYEGGLRPVRSSP